MTLNSSYRRAQIFFDDVGSAVGSVEVGGREVSIEIEGFAADQDFYSSDGCEPFIIPIGGINLTVPAPTGM